MSRYMSVNVSDYLTKEIGDGQSVRLDGHCRCCGSVTTVEAEPAAHGLLQLRGNATVYLQDEDSCFMICEECELKSWTRDKYEHNWFPTAITVSESPVNMREEM